MTKEDQKQRQEQQEVDPQKVEQFISKVINDLGATSNVALAFIGDKLGLYKAMAQATTSGSIGIKPHELASLTNTNERYIREWLAEQVCGGYIIYDSKTGTYSLPKEHAIALTDESSPAYVAGAFQLVMSALKIEPKVTEAFRTGGGFDWNEHDPGFFEGQARFSTPNYKANLVTNWIPSLEGVEQKLSQGGAKVADIGCGFGASTMIMAKAYPNSTFYGFDYHAPSVESARKQVEKEALTEDRVKFEVGSATNFNGSSSADGSGSSGGYDLITFFDCFHDMPDPYSVAKHARNALKADGTCMIVEIASNDTLEENVNSPLGRIGYTGSIFVCVPTALGQIKSDSSSTSSANNNTVLLPLGAMPGISKIEKIMKESGFSRFKCTFNNGFNMVLEARP